MNASVRARFLGAALLLAGCDSRGVNVGTEQLCTLEPRLAAIMPRDPELSNCAAIGENVLLNPSFETPPISSCTKPGSSFCQFAEADYDAWHTSSSDHVIEIWHDGYGDVPSPDGEQFIELDANSQDTVWQDVTLPADQLMYWSLLHRGRHGIDGMDLRVGAADAPRTLATLSTPNDDWQAYSGLFRVGASETTTRLALVSRSGVTEGNFVDAVVLAPVSQ